MLLNETYTGRWSGEPEPSTARRRCAWGTQHRHRQPAGIPKGHEAARVLRPQGRSTPRRSASPYLLSGLRRCETCGTALTDAEAKNGKYTCSVCHSLLKRGSGICKTPRLNARTSAKLIVDELRANALSKSNVQDLA